MFGETKTLIVVCKDELVLNYIRKLVESKDDLEDGTVVGTMDGSIKIVSWDEKMWLANKKSGAIDERVLLIGNIKGIDSLAPVIDIKFDKWAIKYGWAGKQALIQVDEYSIKKKDYEEFLRAFNENSLPGNKKSTAISARAFNATPLLTKSKSYFSKIVSPLAFLGAAFIADYFSNKSKIHQQQMVYGVYRLYLDHLEAFMNS